MSLVVDTSVWSLALRRGSPSPDPQVAKLATALMQRQPIVLLGVILQEVLQGIREESRFEAVKDYLQAFPIWAMDRADYVAAARLWNLCRSKGVQASTADIQIAVMCVQHDCELLTCDRDFEHIAGFCPLRLA